MTKLDAFELLTIIVLNLSLRRLHVSREMWMGLGVKWSKLIRFSVKYDVLIGAINYSCELSNVLDEGYKSQQQCATPAQFTK